ncbi:MAG: hypothetical protein V4694_06755 [Pseudomonadota bacterium]
MSKSSNLLKKLFILSLLFAQPSCYYGKLDPFDTQNGLSRSDIKNSIMKNPEKAKTNQVVEAPIPNISKLIAAPRAPSIGSNKTISFSVTDQVPLKDVLIELGRVAQIDIDLDPGIDGGIILNAKNRPFKEVVDRIASLGNLRYSYQNGVLHFERDTPFMKNYFVDYLIDGQLWSDVETNVNAILSASSSASEDSSNAASAISSNKSAGILSIFATTKEHATITKYLADVERSASAQVLIEAKVVEVSLSETFKAGINWSVLGKQNNITANNSVAVTSGITYTALELFGADISATVSALETFGTTRTLSSPRIHAINNQKASLNFGDKLVYFKIDNNQNVTTTGTSAANTQTITSTKQEENVGVQLDITPSINLRTGEIIMSVKPQLSIKSSTVVDPASPSGISNEVPVIQTRTIDTIAKIKSGSVLVIGGLMKDTTTNTDSGIPFLQRIPILGWLFKSVSKDTTIVETVIFIKATILSSGATANKIDRDMQEKFDTDRRPYFTN